MNHDISAIEPLDPVPERKGRNVSTIIILGCVLFGLLIACIVVAIGFAHSLAHDDIRIVSLSPSDPEETVVFACQPLTYVLKLSERALIKHISLKNRGTSGDITFTNPRHRVRSSFRILITSAHRGIFQPELSICEDGIICEETCKQVKPCVVALAPRFMLSSVSTCRRTVSQNIDRTLDMLTMISMHSMETILTRKLEGNEFDIFWRIPATQEPWQKHTFACVTVRSSEVFGVMIKGHLFIVASETYNQFQIIGLSVMDKGMQVTTFIEHTLEHNAVVVNVIRSSNMLLIICSSGSCFAVEIGDDLSPLVDGVRPICVIPEFGSMPCNTVLDFPALGKKGLLFIDSKTLQLQVFTCSHDGTEVRTRSLPGLDTVHFSDAHTIRTFVYPGHVGTFCIFVEQFGKLSSYTFSEDFQLVREYDFKTEPVETLIGVGSLNQDEMFVIIRTGKSIQYIVWDMLNGIDKRGIAVNETVDLTGSTLYSDHRGRIVLPVLCNTRLSLLYMNTCT